MNSDSVQWIILKIITLRTYLFLFITILIFAQNVTNAQCVQTHNPNWRSVYNPLESEIKFNNRQKNNSTYVLGEEIRNKKFKYIPKDKLTKENPKIKTPGSLFFKPTKIIIDSTTRQTFTYDKSGNCLTEYLDTLFVEYGVWLNSQRITNTYDSSGNRLTELHEQYYFQTDKWEAMYRFIYTYDQYDNLISNLFEIWKDIIWKNNYRLSYTYDNSNNLISKLEEDWVYNTWTYSYRNTYIYDNSGNQLVGLTEYWINNAWRNYNRFTNTYDLSGNCLTELWELWCVNCDKWGNHSWDFYT